MRGAPLDRLSKESHGYVPSRRQKRLGHVRTFWSLLVKTVGKWNDDPTLRFAAALAYYTAFAVVPLVVIVIELATVMLGREVAEGFLFEQVEGLIGQQGAQALGHLLDTWQQVGVVGLATAVEAGTLFFALAGAFDQLQDALNSIWGVQPTHRGGIIGRFRRRFLSVLGLLGTAFLLLVSLVMTAALTAGGRIIVARLPGPELLNNGVAGVISFLGAMLIFAMMFKLLPNAKVAWADVWIGAAVTAALFILGKWVILLYLGETVIVSLYGSTAPFVIILLWAFYSSQIVLFGAEFTAVYASECGSRVVSANDAVAVGEPARTNEALQETTGGTRPSSSGRG